MKNANLFIAFAIAATSFSLMILGFESLSCLYQSNTCHLAGCPVGVSGVIFISLLLFILGVIANLPLLFACLILKQAILVNVKKLTVVAALGPTILYYLLMLAGRPLSEVPLSEWVTLFALFCAGLLSAINLLWIYSRLTLTHPSSGTGENFLR